MNMVLATDQNEIEQVAVEKKSHGTVAFSEKVLARISEIAAAQVSGVASLKISGIETTGERVKMSVFTTLEYGPSVVETARQIQGAIKSAVQDMTGLTVSEVNVDVRSLHIP
ncbi:Asp23/Gls24 family envelope stress response protein [Christensenellaceae bacterium OttesenSCG-928-K19]|nr:Asp23/Gls24 family envelope stress response protein [Christensenellaceae bacterium OttesenSCG-928-K19]